MLTLRLSLLVGSLAFAASASAQNVIDYSANLTANSLGGKGAGQSFTPMDASNYAGEQTLDLLEVSFWSGNLGGPGNSTTYLAVYDGDPDTASLVGMSTNFIDTAVGTPNYTEWKWTFDSLTLDAATEYWAVTSASPMDVHPADTVERSLQEYDHTNAYAGGDAIIADRERHQNNFDLRFLVVFTDGSFIGNNYCGPAALNSTGQSGVISAFGFESVAANDVRLDAAQLALNQNSYFITSMTQGFVMPPGSQGFLCLGGTIGRFNANVLNTGGAGEVSLQIDLTQIPIGAGVAVQPGETWNFQLWYRDANPGATSNFTDGTSILFQ